MGRVDSITKLAKKLRISEEEVLFGIYKADKKILKVLKLKEIPIGMRVNAWLALLPYIYEVPGPV